MIYAIEYLNADAELTVIEYDPANHKTFRTFISKGSSRTYTEPKRTEIFFCEKQEEEGLRDGVTKAWYQKIASFSISEAKDETDTMVDAYIPIEDLIATGELIELFDSMIANRNADTARLLTLRE